MSTWCSNRDSYKVHCLEYDLYTQAREIADPRPSLDRLIFAPCNASCIGCPRGECVGRALCGGVMIGKEGRNI
eukprot:COSAG02_NODE_2505_length_8656_cov_6.225950_5_plen_73_part_00